MAQPLVSDELWSVIEPGLPRERPKPRGGRPIVPDRACLTGILFVLKTGIPWEHLPQEMGCGSGMTCWRRLLDRPESLAATAGTDSRVGACEQGFSHERFSHERIPVEGLWLRPIAILRSRRPAFQAAVRSAADTGRPGPASYGNKAGPTGVAMP